MYTLSILISLVTNCVFLILGLFFIKNEYLKHVGNKLMKKQLEIHEKEMKEIIDTCRISTALIDETVSNTRVKIIRQHDQVFEALTAIKAGMTREYKELLESMRNLKSATKKPKITTIITTKKTSNNSTHE